MYTVVDRQAGGWESELEADGGVAMMIARNKDARAWDD